MAAKKKVKNPAAVSLANARWEKKTEEEKLAFGQKLTRARIALRKAKKK